MTNWLQRLLHRLRSSFPSAQQDEELDAEIAAHLDLAVAENMQRGMTPQEARRQALIRFGGLEQAKQQHREARGFQGLDVLRQDLKFALRTLLRDHGFTFMATLVLAIGIGVNVSAFSLFDMIALKPLPVRDPGSLVRLERRSPNNYASEMPYPSLIFYRDHVKSLSAVIGVLGVPPLHFNNDIQPASASFITPNYFTELGTQAAHGRLFDPVRDGDTSSSPGVVLSYGFWQRRFGSDLSVIGQTLHLNGKPASIIGITPYDFASLGGQHPDIWIPIAQQPYFIEGSHVLTDSSYASARMWGRLAPGITAKMAEQELLALTDELRRQHPHEIWDKEYIQSTPGGHLQVLQPEMYRVAAMVAVLTLLILAVACANLGALLLARAVTREHEIGIRIALGANRSRILRQLCTESLLLAGFGAIAALLLGCAVVRVALSELDAPKWLSAMPDWRVLSFTVVMVFVVTTLFGLAPAFQIARQKQRKNIARQILVSAQVAASCILLIVAGLLVRATQHALYSNPGFNYQQLVSINAQLSQHGYPPAAAQAYLDQMQSRLLATPGAKSVPLVKLPPLGHIVMREKRDLNGNTVTMYPNWVDPGFFNTMEIPLLRGRTFYPREKSAVIVSESVARQLWPKQDPLGQQLVNGADRDVVVGIVKDAHINALNDSDAVEEYWPAQQSDMPEMVIVVRAEGSPAGLSPVAKAISESLDANVFPEIRQLKLLYYDDVFQVQQAATAVGLIGLVAGLLAGVGIIGLVAFTVSQRTKEFAIRIALGASSGEVLAAVLRQFSLPVAAGLLAGAGLAAGSSKVLRKALFGISNLDPAAYAGAIGVLVAIVAIAALVPARRALRLNPAKVLRYE
jgi:putative ABC transport system permease protein